MDSNKPQYYLLAEARYSAAGVGADRELAAQWHFLLEAADGSARLDVADEEPNTPCDRMELLALVRGLEALDQPARVALLNPSKYVTHGLRFGLDQWRENGWQWEAFGQMTPVKNVDLWQRIDQALQFHRIECKTVRQDAAHETPAPHDSPTDSRSRGPIERGPKRPLSKPRKKPAEPRGVWQSVRKGVASWLHGLGESIAAAEASPQRG